MIDSEIINKIIDKSSGLFEAASELVTKAIATYGQQAVDALLWVVRIDAMQVLFTAWTIMLLSAFAIWFIVRGFVKHDWVDKYDVNNYDIDGRALFVCILIIVAMVLALLGVTTSYGKVTNLWSYVAVAKPELYLVKRVVDGVEAKLTTPSKK